MTLYLIDDSRRLGHDMDMRPDLYEVDLISFPNCTWTSQTEFVWSLGCRHKLGLFWSPNTASETCWIRPLGFLGLNWRGGPVGMLGIYWLGPQSTFLVFHAFHVHSTICLIHDSNSKNKNKHTLWCSINSSNVSKVILIGKCFTFEAKVVNMVRSEPMMSSSGYTTLSHPYV